MMYSKHAAALKQAPQHPNQDQPSHQHHQHHQPAPAPEHNSNMADTLQAGVPSRSTHRLLEQHQNPGKPYGGLGEILPGKLNNSNVPHNFHRRTLNGDHSGGMLAYTEHAQKVNQRRYQYNFPQGQVPTAATTKALSMGGMGRKWASLPKLTHMREHHPAVQDPFQTGYYHKSSDRPQSDMIFHEAMSRPNTPVRPASESTGFELPQGSPRIRIQEYKKFLERTQRKQNQSILPLTEEDEANLTYEDDFEKEDSGVEPELKDIPETPVQSAINDLNQPNRNIEIVPFPALAELNTQPAVIHNTAKWNPKPCPSNQVNKNGEWTRKGKTRTVKVTVNNNLKTQVHKPLPSINPKHDSKRLQSYPNGQQKPAVPSRFHPQYSKQMSESANIPSVLPPSPASSNSSSSIDFTEVIVPGIEEEEEVHRKENLKGASSLPPSNPPPIIKEIIASRLKHTEALLKLESASKPEPKHQSPPIPKELKKTTGSAKPESASSKIRSDKNMGKGQVMNGHEATDKEMSDIAVTGNKVATKPQVPSAGKDPKGAKKMNQETVQPVARKGTPVQKPSKPPPPIKPAAKPAIKIPTASSSGSKVPLATQTNVKVPSSDKKEVVQEDDTEKQQQELSEEDSVPDLQSSIRGVLKAKGDDVKKGKKKSVQFGPKFVREVTKITYPWNEVASSDSDSDSYLSDDDDSDEESIIDEEIENALEELVDKDDKATHSEAQQAMDRPTANRQKIAATGQKSPKAVNVPSVSSKADAASGKVLNGSASDDTKAEK